MFQSREQERPHEENRSTGGSEVSDSVIATFPIDLIATTPDS